MKTLTGNHIATALPYAYDAGPTRYILNVYEAIYDYDVTRCIPSSTSSTSVATTLIGPSEFTANEACFPDPAGGHEHDTDDYGVSFYGYRYYKPEIGRWVNRDPIEERGAVVVWYSAKYAKNMNLYTFNSTKKAIYYLRKADEILAAGQYAAAMQLHQASQAYFMQSLMWTWMRDRSDAYEVHRYTFCYNNPINYKDVLGLRVPLEPGIDRIFNGGGGASGMPGLQDLEINLNPIVDPVCRWIIEGCRRIYECIPSIPRNPPRNERGPSTGYVPPYLFPSR